MSSSRGPENREVTPSGRVRREGRQAEDEPWCPPGKRGAEDARAAKTKKQRSRTAKDSQDTGTKCR